MYFRFDPCQPCCPDPYESPICSICEAEDYPEQYEFTISGVTNASCIDCDILNNTFTVTHDPVTFASDCSWTLCLDDSLNPPEDSPDAPCASARIGFRFTLTQLRIYRMTANCAGVMSTLATYQRNSGYNCESHTHTLDRISSTACTNWPATITVTGV